MKTKSMINLALVAVISTGLMFTSCKKKDNNNSNPKYQAANDNSTAEGIYNRSYNQISKASLQVGSKSSDTTIAGCPTLYIQGAGWPKTVTLDFGTSCIGSDYVTRSGQIVTTITEPYIDSNCVVTSTFQNYHEIIGTTDYQAFGTQTITNLGHNQAGHPIYSVVVNGHVTSSNGTINYTSTRQNEWIAGYSPASLFNPFDDEYLVTGTASGSDVTGSNFTVTITQALDFNVMCAPGYYYTVKSGKLEISYPGTSYPTIYVDYGNGTCDYTITVTVNGVNYTIVYF